MEHERTDQTTVVPVSRYDLILAAPVFVVGAVLTAALTLAPMVGACLAIRYLPPDLVAGPSPLLLVIVSLWLGGMIFRIATPLCARLTLILVRSLPLSRWRTTNVIS